MTMTNRPHGRTQKSFEKHPSLTEQEHRDSVNIQQILKRHRVTGTVTHVARQPGVFMNLINAPDYYEAQMAIANANSIFEEIPSDIRARFDNDPGKLLEFVQNEENREEMQEMGFNTEHLPEIAPEEAVTQGNAPQTPSQPLGDAHKQVDLEAAIAAGIPENVAQAVSDAIANSNQAD